MRSCCEIIHLGARFLQLCWQNGNMRPGRRSIASPHLELAATQAGRALSFDDLQHYMRMIIALRETRRVMGEIDEVIPDWPLA
jgi:hypothetical protein